MPANCRAGPPGWEFVLRTAASGAVPAPRGTHEPHGRRGLQAKFWRMSDRVLSARSRPGLAGHPVGPAHLADIRSLTGLYLGPHPCSLISPERITMSTPPTARAPALRALPVRRQPGPEQNVLASLAGRRMRPAPGRHQQRGGRGPPCSTSTRGLPVRQPARRPTGLRTALLRSHGRLQPCLVIPAGMTTWPSWRRQKPGRRTPAVRRPPAGRSHARQGRQRHRPPARPALRPTRPADTDSPTRPA